MICKYDKLLNKNSCIKQLINFSNLKSNKNVINYIMENFTNMENHNNIKTKGNQDLIEQLNKEQSVLIEKLLEIVLKNKTLQ